MHIRSRQQQITNNTFIGSFVAVQPESCAVWMLPFDSLNRRHNELDGLEEVIVNMLYADLCKKGASSLALSLAKLAAPATSQKVPRAEPRLSPSPSGEPFPPTPAET